MTATGFIDIFFAEYDGFRIRSQSVGVGGEIAAMIADSVEFGNVFGDGQQLRHGAKWFSAEIHIKPGHDDPVSTQRQFFANGRQLMIKKLCLVYTDDIDMRGNF